MKTILVGSADSTVSVVESLQEVEKMANAARAIAALVVTEFFRDGMMRLRIFMLVIKRVVFAMGELLEENECVVWFGTMIRVRFAGNRAQLIGEGGGSLFLPHLWCN